MIPTVRHAWQHLLQPQALIIPAKATVYARLLSWPGLRSHHASQPLIRPDGNDPRSPGLIGLLGPLWVDQYSLYIYLYRFMYILMSCIYIYDRYWFWYEFITF